MYAVKSGFSSFKRVLQKPIVVTGILFLILIFVGFEAHGWFQGRLIQEQRADARVELALQGNGLSGALDRRINLVEGLYTFLITEPVIDDFGLKFESFASGLHASTEGVLSIILAPGGIIRYVYPPDSTYATLGENLLNGNLLTVPEAIQQTLDTRNVTISGPIQQSDGTKSIIAYLAVFDRNDQFHSLVSVIFDLAPILSRAGLILDSEDLDVNIMDQDERLIYGSIDILSKDPVTYQIYLREGYWSMASAPKGGWDDSVKSSTALFDAFGFLIICLVSTITYLSASSQSRLRRAVQMRTQEIQEINLRLEDRVGERTRELQTLLEVSRDVASTLDSNTVLSLIFAHLEGVVGYSALTLAIVQDDDALGIIKCQRQYKDNGWIGWAEGTVITANEDLYNLSEPVVIADIREGIPAILDQLISTEEQDGRLPETRSWMVVPLVLKDETLGLLFFEHKDANYYSTKDAELALAFAYQAAVALENARLYEQAQEFAALEERQKLARDLHDSVSQALYGISLGAHTARMVLEDDASTKAQLIQPVDYMLSLAKAGLADMRSLIFELRPEALEQEGLVAALSKQIEVLETRHNLRVVKDLQEPSLSLDAKQAFYRISQEAFNNIVKHAQANEIRVLLRTTEKNRITLEIQDDGVGFDPTRRYPDHFGLTSMHERAESIGAQLIITSRISLGTLIKVEIAADW